MLLKQERDIFHSMTKTPENFTGERKNNDLEGELSHFFDNNKATARYYAKEFESFGQTYFPNETRFVCLPVEGEDGKQEGFLAIFGDNSEEITIEIEQKRVLLMLRKFGGIFNLKGKLVLPKEKERGEGLVLATNNGLKASVLVDYEFLATGNSRRKPKILVEELSSHSS